MALVEWSRLGGDQCENVLGVLLLRRHPRARRIRPSSGDRGVDVYVPTAEGWRVFQIKSYTGALNSTRKGHIKKSWASFTEFVENDGLNIAEWTLLRPENPTWEDEEWLADLTAGASWPCTWGGLDHCEDLAADYPNVIDHYLRDGKDRLDAVVRQHLAAAGFARATDGDPVAPAASDDTLRAVSDAINALDPHFYYDFAVQRRPDDQAAPWPPPVSVPPRSGLVASMMRSDDTRAVTFHICARFEQATEERPIPINFTVSAEPGTPEHEAWVNFVDYGLAPRDALPTGNLTIDLPGELGTSEAAGRIRIGPTADAEQHSWTVRVLDESGAPVASTDLVGPPPSWGLSRRGWSLDLHDPNRAISLTVRVDAHTDQGWWALTNLPMAGNTPHRLRPGLEVAAAFHTPHSVEILLAGGPRVVGPMSLNLDPNPAFAVALTLLDAVSAIQQFTHEPLALPAAEIAARQAPYWTLAAMLLSGAAVNVQAEPMECPVEELKVGDLEELAAEYDLEVLIGDLTIPTGRRVLSRCSMRVDEVNQGQATLLPQGPAQLVLLPIDPDPTSSEDAT